MTIQSAPTDRATRHENGAPGPLSQIEASRVIKREDIDATPSAQAQVFRKRAI